MEFDPDDISMVMNMMILALIMVLMHMDESFDDGGLMSTKPI